MQHSAIRGWLHAHPILSFVFLTYSLTALTWFGIVKVYGRVPIEELFGQPTSVLFVYIGAGAPTIVALIITALTTGSVGLIELGSRVVSVRIGILPWILSLGLPFGMAFGAVAIYSLFSDGLGHSDFPRWYAVVPPSAALLFFAGPLCEETGWRGYLQPHLLRITSPLKAAIFIGIIWCFWHIPLSFTPGTTPLLDTPLAWMQYLVSTVIATTIILVIVVKGNGSIAAAMIFHWASNASLGSVVMPLYPMASDKVWEHVEAIQLGLSFMIALLLMGWLHFGSKKSSELTV